MALTPADLEPLVDSSEFQSLAPDDRGRVLNGALREAHQWIASNGGWTPEKFATFGRVATGLRETALKKSAGEQIASVARTVGGVIKDSAASMATTAASGYVPESPADMAGFGMPRIGSQVREAFSTNMQKLGKSVQSVVSKQDDMLGNELATLKQEIDAGRVPADAQGWKDWLDQRNERVKQAQTKAYTGLEGDTPENRAFAESNSLLGNPRHGVLLLDYLQTRDPAVWDELRKNVSLTPGRAKLEDRQQKLAKDSNLAQIMNRTLGEGAGNYIIEAGDPLEIAGNLLPLFKGAKAVKAVRSGSKLRAAGEVVTGAAGETASELGSQFMDDPTASWEQRKAVSKEAFIGALGLAGLGAAAQAGMNRATPEPQPGVGQTMSDPTAPDVPESTGELTAAEVADIEAASSNVTGQNQPAVNLSGPEIAGQPMSQNGQPVSADFSASVTKDSGPTADQAVQQAPGAGLSPAAGALSPIPPPDVALPEPLMAPARNFTGNLAGSLEQAAAMTRQGSAGTPARSPAVPEADRRAEPARQPQAIRVPLATAYATASQGQSTSFVPIQAVWEQAKAQNPALTPTNFMDDLMRQYEAGSVLLEGANSRQEADAAGLRIDGTPVGTAVRMAMVPTNAEGGMRNAESQPLQNPASGGPVSEIAGVPAKEIFATAKKRHGITNDVNEAGYVLPDGTMLDFSGRADAGYVQGADLRFRPRAGERDYMKGERGVDHREVEWEGQPGYTETWQPMVDFMRLGAIRMDRSGMISMHGRFVPTTAQMRVLKDLVTAAGGAYLDLEDGTGKRAAITLESDKFAKVQGLIRRWAAGENLDEVTTVFSPAELAATQAENEAKLKALGLPTKKGTRVWGGRLVKQALERIAKDTSQPQIMRTMAGLLAKMDLGNLLLRIESDNRLRYAGMYQPMAGNRGEIALNTRAMGRGVENGQGDIVMSLVHEALHHATYRALRSPKNAIQKGAIADLEALRKRARAALAANEALSQFDYELSNTDEFIAGLFTRADFQQALASIPAEQAPKTLTQRVRSMLDEIFRTLAELVVGRKVEPGSVLDAAFAASLRLIEDQQQPGVGQSMSDALLARKGQAITRGLLETTKAQTVAGRTVGTSNPTTAKRTGEGTDPNHNVELARLRVNNPEAYRKNALLLTRYPLVAREQPELAARLAQIDQPVERAQRLVDEANAELKRAKYQVQKALGGLLKRPTAKVKAAEVEAWLQSDPGSRLTKAVRRQQENVARKTDQLEAAKAKQKSALASLLESKRIVTLEAADAIYESYVTAVESNLEMLIKLFPAKLRDTARLWYDGANIIAQNFGRRFDATLEQASAVLAVFSPQKDWFMNVSLAERMMSIWKNDQDTAWSRTMSERFLMRSGEPQPVEDDQGNIVYDEALVDEWNPEGIKYQKGARPGPPDENGDTTWLNWDNAKAAAAVAEARVVLAEVEGRTLRELVKSKHKARFIRMLSEVRDNVHYPKVTPDGKFGGLMTNDKGVRMKIAWGGYNTIEKAISIMSSTVENEHEVISAALGDQHKVRSFYNNIADPANTSGHVTMDTHAVAALLWMPLSGASGEVTQNFGSGGVQNDGIGGLKGMYAANAEAYRRAGEVFGLLPREVQSITWEAVRLLFPKEFKSKANVAKVRQIWDQYRRHELTIDQARNAIFKLAQGRDLGGAIADGRGVGSPSWAAEMGNGGADLGRPQNSNDAGELPAARGAEPGSGRLSGEPGAARRGRDRAAVVRPAAEGVAPLQNPATDPNLTRSRFAPPREADQVINTREDAQVALEAGRWLASVDQQTAIEQFVANAVPLPLDAQQHAAGLLIAQLSAQYDQSSSEVERMWNHVQMQRMARVLKSEFLSADPARSQRQRAVVNNTILQPISAVLAAQEVLIDRGTRVTKARFEGGGEGVVTRIVEIIKYVDRVTGEVLSGDLNNGSAGTPARPGKPADKSVRAPQSPSLTKLLNDLRKKMLPGMTWEEIFTDLPSTQKARQRAIYERLKKDQRLQALTPEERLKLTNELDKAWQRERRKVFRRELDKAGVLGEKAPSDRQKVKNAMPKLLRLINLGMFNSEMFREAIAPEYGLRVIDAATAAKLRHLAEAAYSMPEGILRNRKLGELLHAMQAATGSSVAEIVNSYWTASVLSGLRTQFDTWLAFVNGAGTNLMQAGALLARGQGRNAIGAHAAWWRGLRDGVRESLQILARGDYSVLKKFGSDLNETLKGEKNWRPVPLGESLWQNGNVWQKYLMAPVMIWTGRLMAAADHINNTATTAGAMAVARAMHPELYNGRGDFTAQERADARAQALREITGGNPPMDKQQRTLVDVRTREILYATVSEELRQAASDIGDTAAYQNDPTGLFGSLYLGIKGWLSSTQRMLDEKTLDMDASRFTRALVAALSGSLYGVTGTRFIRFGFNFGADLTRYIPGTALLKDVYGTRMSRMEQDLLIGKNIVGLMITSTLAALFLTGDDEDEGWQIEGDWSNLTPQEQKARMAAGIERMTLWKREDGQVRRVSYKQWPTMALFASVGGMLDEKRHRPDQWAQRGVPGHLLRGALTGIYQVKNVTAMRGLMELFGESSFGTDKTGAWGDALIRAGSNFVGGAVPTLVKDAEVWNDPRSFKPEGVLESVMRGMPIARKFVNDGRPQLNLLGEEVKLQRAPWSRAYTSVASAEAHRVLGALMARGLALPQPSDQIAVYQNGVKMPLEKLGREAVWRYEKAVGEGYRAWLAEDGNRLLAMPVAAADKVIAARANAIKQQALARVTGR